MCAAGSAAAPLHRPSRRFGFLVTCGWIWAGSSVQVHLLVSPLDQHFFFFKLVRVFSLAPALTPFLEAYSCIVIGWRVLESACLDALDLCSHVFYVPVSACLCVCVGTHPSVHPTSNQWCQPFDACSTVTKPYCTHIHTNIHHCTAQFSTQRRKFCIAFLSPLILLVWKSIKHSFVPCLKIIFVQWTKSRYFLILKEIYRYIDICIVYKMLTRYIFVAFYVWSD